MKYFVGFFLLFFTYHILAQDNVLDQQKWEKLRSEVEYKKSSFEEAKKEEKGTDNGNEKMRLDDSASGSTINLGPVVQIIVIVLFILFLAGLLFAIFSNASLKSKERVIETGSDQVINHIEEDFTKSNLEKWLKHAKEQNDHYLILRIQFLMILKSLELKRLILWKKEKTNWHYISELAGHHFQESFQQLVNEFDQVWYGEKNYSEDTLRTKIDQFESFRTQLDAER